MPTLNVRKAEVIPRRDPFRSLYQSARWHRFSKNYLKQNRLCRLCLEKGKTTIALQTDHVQPLVKFGGDPYDLSNLQPLCKRCHSIKTRSENK